DQTFGIADPPHFAVVQQNKGSKLPKDNKSWSQEIALDVEWAHAIAPGANIALIEALNPSELVSAINYARNQSIVSVISMSLSANEDKQEPLADSLFTTPGGHIGETFVVASGDGGAKPQYPSSSPNVLSIGGSTLNVAWNGDWYRAGETAWSGGGGGVSKFEGVPSFQNGLGLTSRGTPDVSYDGNPQSGFAVYDSFGSNGWAQIGGTSAGAPQWAALLAIADQGRVLNGMSSLGNAQAALYSMPSTDFFDVTVGSNSKTSFAHAGYDTATGLGSPNANLLIPDLVAFSGSTDFYISAIPQPTKKGKSSTKPLKAQAFASQDTVPDAINLHGGDGRAASPASVWTTRDSVTMARVSYWESIGPWAASDSYADTVVDSVWSTGSIRPHGWNELDGRHRALDKAPDASHQGFDAFFADLMTSPVASRI
ncbi:MAG TPA: S53 family peptidase, partial [Lacipirellulaceae bacterium]